MHSSEFTNFADYKGGIFRDLTDIDLDKVDIDIPFYRYDDYRDDYAYAPIDLSDVIKMIDKFKDSKNAN